MVVVRGGGGGRRREDGGDGFKAEVTEVGKGFEGSGFKQVVVTKLGVDKGDTEAERVENVCQLKHWLDVVLNWVRDTHDMRLVRANSTHYGRRSHGYFLTLIPC